MFLVLINLLKSSQPTVKIETQVFFSFLFLLLFLRIPALARFPLCTLA